MESSIEQLKIFLENKRLKERNQLDMKQNLFLKEVTKNKEAILQAEKDVINYYDMYGDNNGEGTCVLLLERA